MKAGQGWGEERGRESLGTVANTVCSLCTMHMYTM